MRLKILTAALSLLLLPTLSAAAGCQGHEGSEQAMSCAEGTIYDETTGTCIPLTSS